MNYQTNIYNLPVILKSLNTVQIAVVEERNSRVKFVGNVSTPLRLIGFPGPTNVYSPGICPRPKLGIVVDDQAIQKGRTFWHENVL